jgi:hypothetical protein
MFAELSKVSKLVCHSVSESDGPCVSHSAVIVPEQVRSACGDVVVRGLNH